MNTLLPTHLQHTFDVLLYNNLPGGPKMSQTYCSCGTIPELSEAGVAGVIGVMGVSGVFAGYRGVFPGSAVVVEPTGWEWKS